MFTIIRSEKLSQLESDLYIALDDVKYYKEMMNTWRNKYFALEEKTKGKEMSEFTDFTYGNEEGTYWFEIVRRSDRKLFVAPGFETEAEALEKARELAVKFPVDEFLIIAPIKVVKANIPVVEEDYVRN